MASTAKIISGMQTLLPYYDDPEGFHVSAEHDEIQMHATDRPVSDADVEKLIALDWFQSGYEGDEFTLAEYNVEESWLVYP